MPGPHASSFAVDFRPCSIGQGFCLAVGLGGGGGGMEVVDTQDAFGLVFVTLFLHPL